MRLRKMLVSFMICTLIFSCAVISAGAAEATVSPRVSGYLDDRFSANSITPMGDWFQADEGDTVKYECTYTPSKASVDFGVIAPDGLFYSVNCTSGTINQSIRINQSGQFLLAIRNNESYDVVVTGTVKYKPYKHLQGGK